MKVFGTDMEMLTFVFLIIEAVFFSWVLIFYLQKPFEKKRLYYLILIFLFIVYNIFGGLFPDPHLNVPIILQNILAYGSGFTLACYFPYYFYKAFELRQLKFHARYGVLIFLLLPFFVFMVIDYSINNNLDQAVDLSLIIPCAYAVIVILDILKAIHLKYKNESKQGKEMYLTFAAVLPWVCMPVFSFYRVGQFIEVLVMNGGFLIISILFVLDIIEESREDNLRFQLTHNNTQTKELTLTDPTTDNVFLKNCERFKLTSREVEVVILIGEGLKYKTIAERLFISEKTVSKHAQNMFLKTGAINKVDLINALRKNHTDK